MSRTLLHAHKPAVWLNLVTCLFIWYKSKEQNRAKYVFLLLIDFNLYLSRKSLNGRNYFQSNCKIIEGDSGISAFPYHCPPPCTHIPNLWANCRSRSSLSLFLSLSISLSPSSIKLAPRDIADIVTLS